MLVNRLVPALFRPHECGVEPAAHQGVSEVRRILARDRDLYIGQFIVKDRIASGNQFISFPVRNPRAKVGLAG